MNHSDRPLHHTSTGDDPASDPPCDPLGDAPDSPVHDTAGSPRGDLVSDPAGQRPQAAAAIRTPGRRARRPSRASFGSVRRLPSGRYQARFTDARNQRHTGPLTFATKREAQDYLALLRADMVRGAWRSPELGSITLADYSAGLLAVRVDLAPKTLQLYEELSRLWINAPHDLPAGRGGVARTINLGDMELGSLTVAVIRDWYAAAIHTTDRRAAAAAQTVEDAGRRRRDKLHPARAWALDHGLRVGATGRLPAEVLTAWKRAGSPRPGDSATACGADRAGQGGGLVRQSGRANPPGRARVAQAYRYLRTLLGQAVRDGRITANPCQVPSAGLIKTPERVPATPEQINALAAAMPPRWAVAVQVAAWSSLRAGELFGLARRHVDLEAGTVRVDRAVTYV